MPLPPAPPLAGMPSKFSRVQVNGTILAVVKDDVSFKTELTKATNSESQGWRVSIPGEREVSGTIEAKMVPGQNPHVAPLMIVDNELAYLELFPVQGGDSYHGWAWLHEVKVNFAIPNEIPYSFSFTGEGAWTYPATPTFTYPPSGQQGP